METKRDIKELVIIGVLTVLLAVIEITGFPCSLFLNIQVMDIQPMLNRIGAASFK